MEDTKEAFYMKNYLVHYNIEKDFESTDFFSFNERKIYGIFGSMNFRIHNFKQGSYRYVQ